MRLQGTSAERLTLYGSTDDCIPGSGWLEAGTLATKATKLSTCQGGLEEGVFF
jgi:hypothetical protein